MIRARSWNAKHLGTAFAGVVLASTFAVEPAHAAGGLNLIPDPATLVLLLIGFLLLILPANALIFRPLFQVLDEREQRIEGARRRADQLEGQADEVLGRYRESVSEVREESERGRREQLDTTRGEHASIAADARTAAEQETSRAREEIAASLTQARAELRSAAEGLARDAAERILGRALS